jgi:hypothetical protein
MNLETFERYAENWIDRDVRAAINQSDLGCIGFIIDPLRLSQEVNFFHKKYKDECILFFRSRWSWTETGEEVEIDDFFIETHLEMDITMKQLIKKLQDVRTPFSFMSHVYNKTVKCEDFFLMHNEE